MILGGQRFQYRLVHYRGILKNRDTIVQWQMVPPYPKVNMKWNKERFDLLCTPKTLHFFESKKLSIGDSVVRQSVK